MEELTNMERANGVDLLNWFSAGAEAVAAHKKYGSIIFLVGFEDTAESNAVSC